MNIQSKNRVHEVAKDFGMGSKVIVDVLTRYTTAPKNHMQVLTDEEMNIVFDYLTLQNQVESIEVVFAQTYHEPKVEQAPEPATQPEPVSAAAPEPTAEPAPVPVAAGEQPAAQPPVSVPEKQDTQPSVAAQSPRPAAPQTYAQASQAKPAQPQQPKGQRQTHLVDTRGGGTVDLSKFDERVDALVPTAASKMQQGKQKIKRAQDKKPNVPFGQKRRQEEQERMRRLQLEALKKQPIKVMIPDEIAVSELAMRMKKTGAEVVKQLMKLGVMASLGQFIDFETASLVALEMGAKVEREVLVTIEERLIDDSADTDENLIARDPVVVVMGHVDHGKTSLLDYIRSASVAHGEFGGITQHIGAYRVPIGEKHITFLDTPGHEAFTSMRQRGAQVTDIAILVVAADDGIMPQTIEAINHAKAANLPIVIAINKMDKDDASPDRIMQQLTEYELVPEEWGGETICCPVSAKTGDGVEHLLEMVSLTASMMELKANPNRSAKGTVIEAKLDKGRGPVATVLVQNGTLKQGDIVIAGKSVGRVRAMANDLGEKIEDAGPSVPVEIIGLAEVPGAGDLFYSVEDERMARELVEQRKQQEKDEANPLAAQKMSLDDLYSQIQQGQIKDLNLIVKADVQGSAEAIKASLEKLSNEEVRVRVVHCAVGAINESDILLASTASAIVVGFNVRPDSSARVSAERAGVDLRMYRVIYECIEEIESAMKGMLTPKYKENILGHAQVRQVFKVTGVGTIAGSYVQEGKIIRHAKVRLVRDGIVIHEGDLNSLKRFKDDAKEVAQGYECGIGLERYNDIKEGDIIEAFVLDEIKQ